MPRAAIALLAGALATSPLLHGQDPPTFRAGTTLVEFTIVATDSGGNAVTDLTQADVEFRAGGRAREIAFFRFDAAAVAESTTSPSVPQGFVTNVPLHSSASNPSATVIVLDLLNTAPNEQRSVQEMTARHLDALPAATRLAVYQFSEDQPILPVQELTDDIALVRSRIAKLGISSRRELAGPTPIVGGDCYITGGSISGAPNTGGRLGGAATGGASGSGKAALTAAAIVSGNNGLSLLNKQIRDGRLVKTLASLDALGTHLAAIRGRKNVIWITSGMPALLKRFGQTNYEPQIREAARRLANRGVVVYPVDAKGLCRAGDTRTDEGGDGSHDAPQLVFGSLEVIAETTGGRVLKNTNNPVDGVTTALADLRGTYTVGFYVDDEANDGWQRLEVSTKRQGVTLRHRQGYFSARRAQAQNWQADDWTRVSAQTLAATDIRLHARATAASNEAIIALQIAAADIYFHPKGDQVAADLEVWLIQMGTSGPVSLRAQPMEISMPAQPGAQRPPWIAVQTKWPLANTVTSIRVVVRDRYTGRYGTLDLPFTH